MSRYTPRNFKYCDSDFMDSGLAEPMNKLAHYEDLEEQGKLIVLPCKVGDTVWKIATYQDSYDTPPYKTTEPLKFRMDYYDALGKNLFTTKEEAEAKLTELKGEKDG